MAYTKQIWEDYPSTNTLITAERLNHIEEGIGDAHDMMPEKVSDLDNDVMYTTETEVQMMIEASVGNALKGDY